MVVSPWHERAPEGDPLVDILKQTAWWVNRGNDLVSSKPHLTDAFRADLSAKAVRIVIFFFLILFWVLHTH